MLSATLRIVYEQHIFYLLVHIATFCSQQVILGGQPGRCPGH